MKSLSITSADRSRVLAETADLLREICRAPGLPLDPTSRLEEIEPLDSLRLMETVAMLEDRFHVEIETGVLDSLVTVDDIVDLVLRAAPGA